MKFRYRTARKQRGVEKRRTYLAYPAAYAVYKLSVRNYFGGTEPALRCSCTHGIIERKALPVFENGTVNLFAGKRDIVRTVGITAVEAGCKSA